MLLEAAGLNLERFVAVMRPRTSFEAVDFGFLITRIFWRRLIVAWLLPSLPLMVLLAFWLPDMPFLGLPLFWLLKPLFERPMLFVLSRAIFGEIPRWREVFRWSSIGPGLLADLTLRRLSPQRSVVMPVSMVEGSRGLMGQQRRSLLGRQDLAGGGLTLSCWMAEIAFVVAFFFLLDLLLPSGYTGFDGVDFETAEQWPLMLSLTFYVGYYLAASLLEPFYVGGGFLLYLQRRTKLEGWDVELAFRRMVQRRSRVEASAVARDPARQRGSGGGLAALLLIGLLSFSSSLRADPAAERNVPLPPEDVKAAIEEITALPEFGGEREEESWQWRDGKPLFEPKEPKAGDLPNFSMPWNALRFAALALLIGLVGFFLWHAWRGRASFGGDGKSAVHRAEQRGFGLEADPLAPIADPSSRARRALAEGRAEEALAFLYRGAFQALVGRGLLPPRRDFTEDDCLRYLRRKAAGRPAEAQAPRFEQAFTATTEAWMRVAYGHFVLPEGHILELCDAFERAFLEPRGAAA